MTPARHMAADLTELDTMARTLYGEARSEKLMGLVAVGWVIRNRVILGGWWGDTIDEVCLKPAQFSCWNTQDPNRQKILVASQAAPSFRRCYAVAVLVLLGEYEDPTHGATHYYAPATVDPKWAKSMKVTVEIGNHRFLKRRAGG